MPACGGGRPASARLGLAASTYHAILARAEAPRLADLDRQPPIVIRCRETLVFMIAKLQCVVLDCADVAELSRFYRSLLGGVVNQPDRRWALSEGWATLHTEDGFVLAFQRVDDYQPPRWPDSARPQQFHLDLEVKDLEQAQDDVLTRGATLLDAGDGRRSWRIFADPAGHPFCLVRH